MRSPNLIAESFGSPAVSGLAKALAGEPASLLKLELARISVAEVRPVLLVLLCYENPRRQHGHRGNVRAR